jgi:hypothetical protein
MGAFASKKVLYVTLNGVTSDKPTDDVTEWIAIRSALSLGQRTEMQAAIVQIDQKSKDTELSLKGYLSTFNEFAFVDWRLFDEDGQPKPFSREAIADLDPAYPLVDKAMAEFAQRNPTYVAPRASNG